MLYAGRQMQSRAVLDVGEVLDPDSPPRNGMFSVTGIDDS